MNKYLEKIASWEIEELEKEAANWDKIEKAIRRQAGSNAEATSRASVMSYNASTKADKAFDKAGDLPKNKDYSIKKKHLPKFREGVARSDKLENASNKLSKLEDKFHQRWRNEDR